MKKKKKIILIGFIGLLFCLILGGYLHSTSVMEADDNIKELAPKNGEVVNGDRYKSITIKEDAKGKVTKEDMDELIEEHDDENSGNIIIWEVGQ